MMIVPRYSEDLHMFHHNTMPNRAVLHPRAHLNFEGVDSCCYLWVNGRYGGYSQVSHSTSEFDVTELLHDGQNTLRLLL